MDGGCVADGVGGEEEVVWRVVSGGEGEAALLQRGVCDRELRKMFLLSRVHRRGSRGCC